MTTNIILLYNEIEKEKKQMKIRKAEIKDLSDILRIYAYARSFMKENGNPDQWGNVYPSLEMVREDIEKGSAMCVQKRNISQVCLCFLRERTPHTVLSGRENGTGTSPMECCTELLLTEVQRESQSFVLILQKNTVII